ncbi:hypothetical protein OG921_10155 [Aldersonia sp. NBC_00410]|uniref:hypothetical protein n=1 Tax=Aldersonia sp. NBC_00410 TaxID=2975954 RepID=UPI00225243AF|nr:hypothetical protein [Aldersonia sp. NBC_00410]MCX5043530.1 hypothetical protein [Aldersonia sp. NBC_00410]
MDEGIQPVSEIPVTLAMDYGQFCLDGGLGDPDTELALLDRAMADQPSAGNGTMLLVLCPHQNNFHMPVTVQVWGSRPPADRAEWQQVSEGRLDIDDSGILSLSSPTAEAVQVEVPPGRYAVDVSGRGFVSYGWPGSTRPGDVWRVRLWPSDGIAPFPAQMWDMPGFGVPANTPRQEPAPDSVSAQSLPPTTPPETRTSAIDFDAHPELKGLLGLRAFDTCAPDVAAAIVAMDPQTQRQLARSAAIRAFEFAGLADCDWVRPALEALRDSDPLPVPFETLGSAFRRLGKKDLPAEGKGGVYRPSSAVDGGGERSLARKQFDNGPINRPYYAIPALFSATDPRPVVAAFQALSHACATYAEHVDSLLDSIRTEFGIPV